MKFISHFLRFSEKIQHITIVRAIRDGLVSLIPVLIIGAFALVLKSFPIVGYQNFITTFWDGAIYNFFNFIYTATFGVLSVYMTFAISRAFMRLKSDQLTVQYGAIFASLISFFILSGVFLETFSIDNMGPKSMLVALISGLGASAFYLFLFNRFQKVKKHILSTGADFDFNRMLSTVFPILIVVLSFALANFFIIKVFNVSSFRELYISGLNGLFSIGSNKFAKGFFFVFLSSILWFFGIHGSDALEGVAQTHFAPGLATNMALVEAGNAPTEILTKEFFDSFVLMGGCGAAICLLIAILLFSKNRARRSLGYTSIPSMIFNINELMVFGLPIIFNPIMLIPFLIVPLVCYSVSYLALALGIVPLITSSIEWTTPIFLSGFLTTNSIAGLLLQLVNIILGVLIYLPFVKILDKESETAIQTNYAEFMHYYRANERELQNKKISELNNIYGVFAKELCADLRHDLSSNIEIYYQPQYNYENKCVGVEALLRWKHPVLGMVYPPLVVKLAHECSLSNKLEEAVFVKVLQERDQIIKKYGKNIRISINTTGSYLSSGALLELLRSMNKESPLKGKNICVELTEQEIFAFNNENINILLELKKMGVYLAIDDFSMGQTSLHYLKDNLFDEIKIDGSLVKGLSISQNYREIVSSLVELADSLSLLVVAEYVETSEEKEMLHKMGCNCYQGYLYSPAVPLKD